MMNYNIRAIQTNEYALLEEFLFEAIFIPAGSEVPPRSILLTPELQVYINRFGNSIHDHALIAEIHGEVIGAIWVRIMDDYGHVDDNTPSLAMSIVKTYRGLGIGSALLKELLSLLKDKGYQQVSLSVQKDNYAVRLYERNGFVIVKDQGEELIMVKYLEGDSI